MENLENEIWKDIKGYEGLYKISNMGRVKSFHKNKETILKGKITDGYYQVTLCKGKDRMYFRINRLVAKYFCYNDDPENKVIVHHINENKIDNRAENLEWVTPLENSLHSSYKISDANKGHEAKNKIKVRCIETQEEFETMTKAGKSIGVTRQAIRYSIRNKTKIFDKYSFEYIDNNDNIENLILEGEIWKSIDNYPNYEISNFGRVKSLSYNHTNKPRILKPGIDRDGYYLVTLWNNSKKKTINIHKLVALHFCEGYEEGFVVNHIDSCKTNNNPDNLEWVSIQRNSEHGCSKSVICLETKEIFISIIKASYKNKVTEGAIRQAIKRNGTSAGCHWKYLNYKHNVILRGKDISKLHKNDKRLEYFLVFVDI